MSNKREGLILFLSNLVIEFGVGVIPLHKVTDSGKCSCGDIKCETPGKHPVQKGWQTKLARTKDEIATLLLREHKNNFGLVLSPTLGAIDVDPRNGGNESIKGLKLPEQIVQFTGGGGTHHLVQTDPKKRFKNIKNFLPGVDFKTRGGFIVIEPSNHKSGGYYSFANYSDVKNIEQIPEEFLKLIESNPKKNTNRFDMKSDEIYVVGKRNEVITSLTGQLRYAGVSEKDVLTTVNSFNQKRCSPPMELSEISKIIRSIYSYEGVDLMKTLPLTDFGLAERFQILWGDDVKYVSTEKNFYEWDGCRHKKIKSKIPVEKCELLSRELENLSKNAETEEEKKKMKDAAMLVQTLKKVNDFTNILRNKSKVELTDFDVQKNLLNFTNCTLNIDTLQTYNHNKKDLISRLIPYGYDAAADCVLFKQFLIEIHQGKNEIIDFMQKIFGYSLLAENPEQVVVFKYGFGSNGKTTETEIHSSLLGEYSVSTPISTFLESKSEKIRNDLARLKDARLVTASEVSINRYLDESQLKEMTGGEKITARFLYGEYFEFKPKFLPVLSMNYKPKIRGTDDGIWRRIISIPYNAQFTNETKDKALMNKLLSELPGIMNWALQGYHKWLKEGLEPYPGLVQFSNSQYRHDEDTSKDFFVENLVYSEGGRTLYSDIKALANEWCKRQGGQETISDRVLPRMLAQMGGKPINVSGGARAYLNIKIKTERTFCSKVMESVRPLHDTDSF